MRYEFPVVWQHCYQDLPIETRTEYSALFGKNEDEWPIERSDTGHLVTDLEDIVAYNPTDQRRRTTIRMINGNAFILDVPYGKFKKFMDLNGYGCQKYIPE